MLVLHEALPVIAVAAELARVHPRAEGRGGSGEHDCADLGVLAERAEGVGQLDPQVDGESISLFGPLERDHRDFLATLEGEEAGHGGHHLRNGIRRSNVKAHTEYMTFNTDERREFVRITENVQSAVDASGVAEGMVLVSAMHITAAVWVNDDEPGLQQDTLEWLDKVAPPSWKEPANEVARELLPDPGDYRHHRGGEDNGDAHLKNLLVHHQVVLPITEGRLDLGPWQAVFYCEFDGRRSKRLVIKVMGD